MKKIWKNLYALFPGTEGVSAGLKEKTNPRRVVEKMTKNYVIPALPSSLLPSLWKFKPFPNL
jgi:hypothetical protein